MPNRIVRDGLNDSRAFNALSETAQIFYVRLMLLVDDYGRYEADPELLRAKLFGRVLDKWSVSRVSDAMQETGVCLTDDGHPLVILYQVQGSDKKYLQINNFKQRVRAEKSKFPSPDGQLSVNRPSDDGHMTGIRTPRARAGGSYSESYSESETEARAEEAPPLPEPEVESYETQFLTALSRRGIGDPDPSPQARTHLGKIGAACEAEGASPQIAAAVVATLYRSPRCRDKPPEYIIQAAVGELRKLKPVSKSSGLQKVAFAPSPAQRTEQR